MKPTCLRGHKDVALQVMAEFWTGSTNEANGIGQGAGCIGESAAGGRQEELQSAIKHRFNVLHVVVVPKFPCGMSGVVHTLLQSPLFTMLSPVARAFDD